MDTVNVQETSTRARLEFLKMIRIPPAMAEYRLA
jgi:hypothetical protein